MAKYVSAGFTAYKDYSRNVNGLNFVIVTQYVFCAAESGCSYTA